MRTTKIDSANNALDRQRQTIKSTLKVAVRAVTETGDRDRYLTFVARVSVSCLCLARELSMSRIHCLTSSVKVVVSGRGPLSLSRREPPSLHREATGRRDIARALITVTINGSTET
uniref:Uncharacterized protein n=1 Tax=Pectinophora gossypiella TaxID=13191 RepID=A0A1E1WAM9_PECGO